MSIFWMTSHVFCLCVFISCLWKFYIGNNCFSFLKKLWSSSTHISHPRCNDNSNNKGKNIYQSFKLNSCPAFTGERARALLFGAQLLFRSDAILEFYETSAWNESTKEENTTEIITSDIYEFGTCFPLSHPLALAVYNVNLPNKPIYIQIYIWYFIFLLHVQNGYNSIS